MLAIASAAACGLATPSTSFVRHVPKSGVGRQPWADVRSAAGPSGWVWQHADWEGRTSGAAAALTLAQSRSSAKADGVGYLAKNAEMHVCFVSHEDTRLISTQLTSNRHVSAA